MARIAGINIPVHKHTVIALMAIYGIGRTRAIRICDAAGIEQSAKVKDLTVDQVDKLRVEVAKYPVEGDLRREISMNVKSLMDGFENIRPADPSKPYDHVGTIKVASSNEALLKKRELKLRAGDSIRNIEIALL